MRLKVGALAALYVVLAAGSLRAQRLKLPVGLEDLRKAAVADSNDAIAHYNVALGYWSEGRFDEAEGELRETSGLDPRFAPAYLALAMLPFAQRSDLWDEVDEDRVPAEWEAKLKESDRLYQRAFLVDPLVELRIVGAVVPPKSVLWTSNPELAAVFNDWLQGFDDFRDGDYEAAYFRFDRMIGRFGRKKSLERAPGSIVWLQGIAAAHLENYEVALRNIGLLYERSLAEEEKDQLIYLPLRTNEYRYVLAFVNQRAGNLDEAVALYREALENDLGLYMAHVRLAEIHEARKEWAKALQERHRAVQANPGDASLVLDLGITQAKLGQSREAMATMREVIAENPRDPRPYYFLGILEQAGGANGEARSALESFLALAPSRFGPQIRDARGRLEALR